ncbi:MAG: hypothetical protein ACW963_07865, partial [Candidatus Sifarchaeia archaeon]
MEIVVPDYEGQIFSFLRNNIKDAEYNASFSSTYRIEKSWWRTLLRNKYGNCIGVLITPEKKKGCILILPQLSKKPEAIVTLLREVLPDISPILFPHIEGFRWVERDEYEFDSILECKAKKDEVKKKAVEELEEIDKKISEERTTLGFLHQMLTATGSDLVKSVELCLRLIGFEQVLNVDEEMDKQDETGAKQEDIQLHDKSPVLLMEVKGLSGLPREADTIQVVKYVPRRMKEWD